MTPLDEEFRAQLDALLGALRPDHAASVRHGLQRAEAERRRAAIRIVRDPDGATREVRR